MLNVICFDHVVIMCLDHFDAILLGYGCLCYYHAMLDHAMIPICPYAFIQDMPCYVYDKCSPCYHRIMLSYIHAIAMLHDNILMILT